MPLENLNKPPLVEVIFEIKFKDPNIINYDLLVGDLNSKLKDKFGFFETLKPPETPSLLMPFIMQHRFRSVENGYPLYQIGPGIVSYNVDGVSYERDGKWEAFKENLLDFLLKYKTVFGEKFSNENIEHIGLRYINKISDTSMYPGVKDYFSNKLDLNIDLNFATGNIDYLDNLEHCRLSQQYFLDSTKKTKLNFDLFTITEDSRKLVLDISMTSDQIPIFDNSEWLEEMHQKIEDFFNKITDKIQNVFQ